MKYYRNSGNPPENRERIDSTKRVDASPSLSPTVPDVLVRSIHNPAFLYEEIDAMKPPETHPNVQNQWQPPFNEMLNYYENEVHNTKIIDPELNVAPPAYPGRTSRSSSNPPPPVPNTRRPSAQLTPRMRSLTDVNPMPPLPQKRRSSDAPDPLFNPSFNPNSRMLSDDTGTSNSSNPIGISNQRRQPDSLGISPNPHPPVPGPRRPSEGNPSERISEVPPPDGISGQQTAIYSNFPISPISEAGEGPNGDNSENDDTDENGYIQCIHSYPPQNEQHK